MSWITQQAQELFPDETAKVDLKKLGSGVLKKTSYRDALRMLEKQSVVICWDNDGLFLREIPLDY